MNQPAAGPDRYDPTTLPDPAHASPHRTGPSVSRRFVQWAVVGVALALVLAPVLSAGLPGEIARWHDAAAWEKYLNGDVPGAIARLDTALTWDDKSAHRYLQRAQWKRENRDYNGSLDDCNRALLLAPSDPKGYLQRSQTYQRMGAHKEAVEDWKEIEKLDGVFRESALNARAYAHAVGNLELDEGLKAAQEAIAMLGGDAKILEQTGYLHVLRKDWPLAKSRLGEAIAAIEAEHALVKSSAEQATDRAAQNGFQARGQALENRLAAVQLYLADVHRELGDLPEAEKLEKRARTWGRPEALLRSQLPSAASAWARAENHAAVIDTRGYLYYRLGDYIAARRDLELAVELAEVDYRRVSDEGITEVDIRRHHLKLREHKRNVAVILYHRALVYEKLGSADLAAQDLARIRTEFELTPGDDLY